MGNSSAKSKAKSITKLSEPKTEIFDKIDAVLFDCDGVIWHGDNLVEGVPECQGGAICHAITVVKVKGFGGAC